jgi:DNA primase
MTISPRFLEELRDRLTLSDVIGRRVKLTRAGREFKACCPFHREKSPSFYVNDDKQFFHCFGCGAHGDIVGFVMRHDNMAFPDAVESLAQMAGMEMPRQTPQDIARAKEEKNLFTLIDDTAKFFEQNLYDSKNAEVRKYLDTRGLNDDLCASFRVGYAPAGDQELRQFLRAKGYTDQQMLEAGVLKASQRGGEAYSFFRDRVMFPVADMRGRIVAFGGRVLPESLRPLKDPNNKPPKYINSADHGLFHKGRMLYAQQLARMAVQNDQPLVVVEGYMDVIACHAADFRGAVAPLGTALTEEQILLLWKMIPREVKEPVLCFDGDNAGYRAAYRAAERVLPLLKPNHSIKFVFLPEGEDPDTLIRTQGRAAFQRYIDKAFNLVDFLWAHHTAGKNFTTPELRAGLSNQFDNLVKNIADTGVQYHYRQALRDKVRGMLGANNFTLRKKSSGDKGALKSSILVPPPQSQVNRVLDILISGVIVHPELYRHAADEIANLAIHVAPESAGLLDIIIKFCDAALNNEEQIEREALAAYLNDNGQGERLADIYRTMPIIHAGFLRSDTDFDVVLRSWKSLFNQWDKSKTGCDIKAAAEALRAEITPENERRLWELQKIQRDMDEEIA